MSTETTNQPEVSPGTRFAVALRSEMAHRLPKDHSHKTLCGKPTGRRWRFVDVPNVARLILEERPDGFCGRCFPNAEKLKHVPPQALEDGDIPDYEREAEPHLMHASGRERVHAGMFFGGGVASGCQYVNSVARARPLTKSRLCAVLQKAGHGDPYGDEPVYVPVCERCDHTADGLDGVEFVERDGDPYVRIDPTAYRFYQPLLERERAGDD